MRTSVLTMGLCQSRHDMPEVEGFVFGQTLNPLDIVGLDAITSDKLNDCRELHLYVTGLTVALVSVINYCIKNAVKLTLYHFDRNTNTYYQQVVGTSTICMPAMAMKARLL